MEQRRFGNTDLTCSAIGFGTWELSTNQYGAIDVSEANRAVSAAIDHGITFNVDHKLRTVIWDFANQPLPLTIIEDLRRLRQEIDNVDADLMLMLTELLTSAEIKAFKRRLDGIIHLGHFPSPSRGQRSMPWPPV